MAWVGRLPRAMHAASFTASCAASCAASFASSTDAAAGVFAESTATVGVALIVAGLALAAAECRACS